MKRLLFFAQGYIFILLAYKLLESDMNEIVALNIRIFLIIIGILFILTALYQNFEEK